MKIAYQNQKKHDSWVDSWNRQVLAHRADMIAKITAMQPAIKEEKLNALACEQGNAAIEKVLLACQEIASLI